MSRIRVNHQPGEAGWRNQGPSTPPAVEGHEQGAMVVGLSGGQGNADGPRDDLANARRRAANAEHNAKRAGA